jgi:hypothetical protein
MNFHSFEKRRTFGVTTSFPDYLSLNRMWILIFSTLLVVIFTHSVVGLSFPTNTSWALLAWGFDGGGKENFEFKLRNAYLQLQERIQLAPPLFWLMSIYSIKSIKLQV